MTMNELLAGKPGCTCGMNHICPVKRVIIGEHACDALPELVAPYRHILLVADRNTYAVGGKTASVKLGDRLADTLIYAANGILVPDESAIDELRAHITQETDLIIGVGSGVINDLCKYVSFAAGLPYMIVATAPSMDGYASKGAALILNGMKVTLNANVPRAILADTEVLRNAPYRMIQAGYGDIIGKYSCLNDWKLSHLVNGEPLCELVWNTTYKTVEKTVQLAPGLVKCTPEAVGTLMEALVTVGILMAYVGNSRPASGSEHHMSHFFEIVGIARGEDYFPHGIDVCYSAVETAKLREQLLAIKNIHAFQRTFDLENYERNIRRVYGAVADEVLALQQKLGWNNIDRVSVYRQKWQKIRTILAGCPSSAQMLGLVEQIGLPYSDFTNFYGKEKIHDALFYAKDLKDRYSVLWMYNDLFTDDAANI